MPTEKNKRNVHTENARTDRQNLTNKLKAANIETSSGEHGSDIVIFLVFLYVLPNFCRNERQRALTEYYSQRLGRLPFPPSCASVAPTSGARESPDIIGCHLTDAHASLAQVARPWRHRAYVIIVVVPVVMVTVRRGGGRDVNRRRIRYDDGCRGDRCHSDVSWLTRTQFQHSASPRIFHTMSYTQSRLAAWHMLGGPVGLPARWDRHAKCRRKEWNRRGGPTGP